LDGSVPRLDAARYRQVESLRQRRSPVLKKILPWVVVAFVLFFIVRNPHGAATTGHRIGAGIASAAGAVADFFTSLVGRR
jgi:hypothetical protein